MALFDAAIAPLGKHSQKLVEDAKSASGAAEYLDHMEKLFRTYRPFASPEFQYHLLTDDSKFDSLTWEMILGVTLIEKGYHLEPSRNDYRPDLCLIHEEKKIWIECSLPSGGDPLKPNSVPPLVFDGEAHKVDHDKSVLRCTQALYAKKAQPIKWIAEGVCNQDESFIIAINGRNLRLAIYQRSLPHILRALYGAGDIYVAFDSKDASCRESGYLFKAKIAKSENAEVSTTFFLERDNAHISGVIFSTDWIMHYSSSPQYSYVENINADYRAGALFGEFCQTYDYQVGKISMRETPDSP
jgi:hypothetical protein